MSDWAFSVSRASSVFDAAIIACTAFSEARGLSGYLVLGLQDGPKSVRSQFWAAPICMEGTVKYNDDPPYDARIIAMAKAAQALESDQDTGVLPKEELKDWQPEWAGGIRVPALDWGVVRAAFAFCGELDAIDVEVSQCGALAGVEYLGRNLLKKPTA